MSSIFTKIINGEVPSYKIYENEYVYSFLTRDAIQLGHTLIIPKVEVDYFVEVPEPYYSSVFKAAIPIAKAIQQATRCKRVGTIIAGWDVPHFHYHVVPMWGIEDLDFRRARIHSDQDNLKTQEAIIGCLTNLDL